MANPTAGLFPAVPANGNSLGSGNGPSHGPLLGKDLLPWGLIPSLWLICTTSGTGINCTYAPYAQGPRSWLSFCFILVAFLQPSPA